jgi:hypothetical protein
MANYCPNNLSELHTTARNQLKSAQKRPSIIAACWMQAKCGDVMNFGKINSSSARGIFQSIRGAFFMGEVYASHHFL